ncbi:hypothetical protein LWC35_18635 [Pseudonocardia kujensis]|nr:hypothetical protein [Pseudonocardia kujensis]
MIALTQTRGIGPGAAYVEKLLAAGKTRTEALRLLRRRLSDAVFAALRADEPPATAHAGHGERAPELRRTRSHATTRNAGS